MTVVLADLGIAFARVAFIMGFVLNLGGLLTWVERKQSAVMQDRVGANRASILGLRLFGLFHPLADAVKMLTKEDFMPARADRVLFQAAPVVSVFYDLDSFEVIKAESRPGAGGENDVAGQYVHLMMQAWDLTKDDRYLHEAEAAARTLAGLGFHLPGVFAVAAALAESIGSLLVSVGLLTRVSAGFVGFTMLVAIYRHLSAGQSAELVSLYLPAAIAIGLGGAGRYSLDGVLVGRGTGQVPGGELGGYGLDGQVLRVGC